jgi:hypothetical protein
MMFFLKNNSYTGYYTIALLILTFATFSSTLPNGFVGDDSFLFVNNTFYKNWSNFPRLFDRSYLTDSNAVVNTNREKTASGEVAYRPVLSTTYFVEHTLWGDWPFGFHLTNVIIHTINALLMYLLIWMVFKDPWLAFVGAAIFSFHPLKSEPVSGLSYRTDSLASLFVMLSLWMHIKEGGASAAKWGRMALSLLFFFLAVFTKESAVVVPFVVIAYDLLIKGRFDKKQLLSYGGYFFVLAFYFYIYFFVFTNHTIQKISLFNGSIWEHSLFILRILREYVIVIIFPWLVKSLPPLYEPPLSPNFIYEIVSAVLVVAGLLVLLVIFFKRQKKLCFFLFFALISFLPVSNIIPIVNPMAYRFLYLPSVGYSVILAYGIIKCFDIRDPFTQEAFALTKKHWALIAALFFCMATTCRLNLAWYDNKTMAYKMLEDFPENPMGYYYFGISHFKNGVNPVGCQLFQKSADLGLDDPRVNHMLGVCHITDLETSKGYFERNIKNYPAYAMSYVGMGRYYIFKDDIDASIPFLEESLELAPKYSAYGYLIQVYLKKGQPQKARELLRQAESIPLRADHLRSLHNFFDPQKFTTFPIDVGI